MEYVLDVLNMPRLGLRSVGGFFVVGFQHIKDHFIPHARNNYRPHILGDRALALFSGFLVALRIFTIALVTFGPVLPAFSSAITVNNIITLTNESRKDFSLNGLTENKLLDAAAQAKADDMLAKGYFAHVTPDGKTPWSFITAAGYNYLMAGENLAVNFSQAEDVETAWMNSPGHKANILNKNFEDIGIGISQGSFQGHNAIFVVQEFGVAAEQKIAITTTPTPVQTTSVPIPAAALKLPQPTAAVASGSVKAAAVASIKGSDASVTVPDPLAITDAQTQTESGQIQINLKTTGEPVKVLASFGDRAIMLSPKADGTWSGQVNLEELISGNETVQVKAVDMAGAAVSQQLADFTGNTVSNYSVVSPPDAGNVQVNWLGRIFSPTSVEQRFYMLFIVGMLSSMVLAIGLKRHVQHLSLITNGSFVVMLACLLWMAG